MTRVKGGIAAKARHRKVRKLTKGYRHKNHTTFVYAKQASMKAGLHAYKGRKQKKRDFRSLWITRITAALRAMGLRYSEIKNKWLHSRMEIDRKNLSEIAVQYPAVFEKIVEVAKETKK